MSYQDRIKSAVDAIHEGMTPTELVTAVLESANVSELVEALENMNCTQNWPDDVRSTRVILNKWEGAP